MFESVENLYVLSKNKSEFIKILIQNNVILSSNLINKLTCFSLKEISFEIYNNLISQNINIIHIEDKRYPHSKFINMYNNPICLFMYGNVNKLKEKVVYLHHEDFNKYGEYIYDIFYEYIKQKRWNVIINIDKLSSKEININVNNNNNNKIYITNKNIFDMNFKIKRQCDFSYDNLILFIPNNKKNNENKEDNEYNEYNVKKHFILLEILVSISDICVILQAKYDKDMYVKNMVDIFLEQEKNVLVTPGNILSKYSYFSNYLIKEGAEIILNKYDIDKYL